jgi:predicted TIM-barrel fold metal-dependent hydrolase
MPNALSRGRHQRDRGPTAGPLAPWARGPVLLALLVAAGCSKSGLAPTPTERREGASSSGKARLPIIDSHVHISPVPEAANLALRVFAQVGIVKFAVKSAGVPGEARFDATRELAALMGEKMAFFSNLDFDGLDASGWAEREAERMAYAMRQGASGIKIFKNLGLGERTKDGKLLRIDDPRLEPIWRRAGELGAIVAWHVADPVAFFKKPDETNERWDELKLAPDWSFYGGDFPSFDELLDEHDKVVASHPKTTFLAIHMGHNAEDLKRVARTLDRYPNWYVDTSARIGEFGRHPREEVRAFFTKYQDRILFGSDFIATAKGMQLGSVRPTPPTFEDAVKFYADHRRYFETADRQIDHPTPIQGRWKVDAIDLPEPVLRKLYYDNADRLIFAPRRAWLKQHAEPEKKTSP